MLAKKLDSTIALKAFQKENTGVISAREHSVKARYTGLCKDPRKNLKACPKICFEEQEGVILGQSMSSLCAHLEYHVKEYVVMAGLWFILKAKQITCFPFITECCNKQLHLFVLAKLYVTPFCMVVQSCVDFQQQQQQQQQQQSITGNTTLMKNHLLLSLATSLI